MQRCDDREIQNDVPVLIGSSLCSNTRMTSARCSPAEPSSVYERSKAFGPRIFISQRSLAREPKIETRHSPGLSASTCSIAALISARPVTSPVLCSSTKTPMTNTILSFPQAVWCRMKRIAQDYWAVPINLLGRETGRYRFSSKPESARKYRSTT
jgi:hypothetical protein